MTQFNPELPPPPGGWTTPQDSPSNTPSLVDELYSQLPTERHNPKLINWLWGILATVFLLRAALIIFTTPTSFGNISGWVTLILTIVFTYLFARGFGNWIYTIIFLLCSITIGFPTTHVYWLGGILLVATIGVAWKLRHEFQKP